MSLLVVYQSETGFTEQYAKWIAEELDCEFMSIKKVKSLESYDTVIFGGWVFGNMIMGLDNINKLAPKKLIAFACGASKESEEVSLSQVKVGNYFSFLFYPLFILFLNIQTILFLLL